jgi:hypothetical protein
VSKESQEKKEVKQVSNKTAAVRQRSTAQMKLRDLGTRRTRRKTNIRFFILLAIWVIALIIALLFISGKFKF